MFLLNKKAQVAMEYVTVLTIAIAIILPAALLFYNYSRSSNIEVMEGQMNIIGDKILSNAEAMYALGEGSWVQLEVKIPEVVQNIYFVSKEELVIKYKTLEGEEEAVFFTELNITTPYHYMVSGKDVYNISADFHAGTIKIKIESNGTYIIINEV